MLGGAFFLFEPIAVGDGGESEMAALDISEGREKGLLVQHNNGAT